MDKNNPTDNASPDAEPPHAILVANEQSILAIDPPRLQAAVRSVLEDSPYRLAMVSVAVVDDPTIHALNRQYLDHDYPTDVLSFVLEDRRPRLVGELIVSAATAQRNAAEYGWSPSEELLLYVVHGALHLVGYGDKTTNEVAAMREAEAAHLRKLGVSLPSQTTQRQEASTKNQTRDEVPTS